MTVEDVRRRRLRYRNSYYSATAEEVDLLLDEYDKAQAEIFRLNGELTMIARWMGDSNHLKRFARWLGKRRQEGGERG
jgi:hypothetical protein